MTNNQKKIESCDINNIFVLTFENYSANKLNLVKLQDWVAATGHKVVIIFEGSVVAGKSGVIKRITQRLNPCNCRVARTQWYFNATFRIYMQQVKSCYLTKAGITARVLNVSWAFVTMSNTKSFSTQCLTLKEYWFSISDEE